MCEGIRNAPPRGHRGFTILELTIALVLFSIIIFSLGILIPSAQIRMRNTTARDLASTLAENMMEEIQVMSWERLIKGAEFDGTGPSPALPVNAGTPLQFPPAPYPSITMGGNYGDPGTGESAAWSTTYRYKVKTLYDPGYPASEDLVIVSVQVHWAEALGTGGSAGRVVTVVSKRARR